MRFDVYAAAFKFWANAQNLKAGGIIIFFILSIFPFHQLAFCQNDQIFFGDGKMNWEKITSVSGVNFPVKDLKGAFVGFHNGAILIAGGRNFSYGDSLNPVDHRWNDKIFVIRPNVSGTYELSETAFEFPIAPAAFGGSVSTSGGVVCSGGVSENGRSRLVFLLRWNEVENAVELDTLPALPMPLALVSGAFYGSTVYLSTGILQSVDNNNSNTIFTLDLSASPGTRQWKPLELPHSYTGIFPAMTFQSDGLENCLFFFGGLETTAGNGYNRSREVFRYYPGSGRLKPLSPFPFEFENVAEPQPGSAIPVGATDVLYFDKSANRSFLYHTITDNWEFAGSFPDSIALLFGYKNGNKIHAVGMAEDSGSPVVNIYEISFQNEFQNFGYLNIFVLILYFVLLVLMGFYFSKKQKNADDYFRGGRKIPWWAAGLSLYGTGLSAITYMAVPAKTFATDWAYFMTKLPQILIPIVVCWLFIPFYRKLDITSAYEYLERRFNRATRLVGSLSFIIFQIGRIGIVLYLPAVALNVATGMDIIFCIVLMGLISLVYTIMGGIEAVIWSDVFQVIVLIGGIFLCLVLISFQLEGGLMEIVKVGQQHEKFEILNMALDFTQPTFWVVVLSGFFSQLIVYSTDQSMVQRYLTTKDLQGAKRSIWTSTIVSLSIGWIYFFVGTALFAFYKKHPAELLPAMQSTDAIFPWYIFSQLPDGINGLLIAGIFAAAMSSLSSSMNSAATAYTVDFHGLFKITRNALHVGRIATLVIGIIGIVIALMFATMDIKSIWDEFIKIIGLIVGGLGGVFLLGIISSRANGTGALAGLVISSVVQFLLAKYQPVHFLLFTMTGFVTCLISGYLASLMFPKHSKPIEELTIYSGKSK